MTKIEEIERHYHVVLTVPVVIPGISFEKDKLQNELMDIPDVFSCGIEPKYSEGRTRIGVVSRTLEGMQATEGFVVEYFKNRKEPENEDV